MNNSKEPFKVICPWGFGHSGSGVYVDVMSEIDNATVVGSHYFNTNKHNKSDSYEIEVDFCRRWGGVFELERAFSYKTPNSIFYLYNFFNLCEFYYKYDDSAFYDDEFLKLSYEFANKLIESKFSHANPLLGDPAFKFDKHFCANTSRSDSFSPYTNNYKKYAVILKDLSVSEYIKYAKEYINSILSRLNPKEFLVLDNFVSGFDLNKIEDYIDNVKFLCAYRDPRDVYVTGVLLNEIWIPKEKECFVKWYKSQHIGKLLKEKNDNLFMYRFEDMVLNYETFINNLFSFLGISLDNHIRKKEFFDPNISIQNVGLYKNYNNIEPIKYIEETLSEFCYEGS